MQRFGCTENRPSQACNCPWPDRMQRNALCFKIDSGGFQVNEVLRVRAKVFAIAMEPAASIPYVRSSRIAPTVSMRHGHTGGRSHRRGDLRRGISPRAGIFPPIAASFRAAFRCCACVGVGNVGGRSAVKANRSRAQSSSSLRIKRRAIVGSWLTIRRTTGA